MRNVRWGALALAALTLIVAGCEQSGSDSASGGAQPAATTGGGSGDGATAGTTGGTTAGSTAGTTGGTAAGTTGTGTDPTGTDPGTSTAPAAFECPAASVKPLGAIQTSAGDIIYQNHTAEVTATHEVGSGCVNGFDVTLRRGGGCRLALKLGFWKGSWRLEDATFEADAKCADGFEWPEDARKTYKLDPLGSVVVAAGLPDAVPNPAAATSCVMDRVDLAGRINFVAGESLLTVKLVSLALSGTIASVASEAGGCPAKVSLCENVSCGEDPYGSACGGCEGDLVCAAGTCQPPQCKPLGDGKTEGFHIADVVWNGAGNAPVRLHDFCGEKDTSVAAVWIIKVAGWCSACAYLAPSFQGLYDIYAPKGVKFVLLVGQDTLHAPATAAFAQQYKQYMGYQAGWIAVADPNWVNTEKVMIPTSNGIPAHLLLDKNLVLRHSSTSTDFVFAPQVAMQGILAEEQ